MEEFENQYICTIDPDRKNVLHDCTNSANMQLKSVID